MKKLLLAILSLVYLTLASGLVMNVHYCMGKVTSIDYGYRTGNDCERCGMKNKKGCCHQEYKLLKLTADQQLAKTTSQAPAPFSFEIPACALSLLQIPQGSAVLADLRYHSPPDKRSGALYLHDCIFRI